MLSEINVFLLISSSKPGGGGAWTLSTPLDTWHKGDIGNVGGEPVRFVSKIEKEQYGESEQMTWAT